MSGFGEAISSILRHKQNRLIFYCPGCEDIHSIALGPNHWHWNGCVDRPTIEPSIFVNPPGRNWVDIFPSCHSKVKGGQIRFLNDSTHALAGKTVAIPDFPLD